MDNSKRTVNNGQNNSNVYKKHCFTVETASNIQKSEDTHKEGVIDGIITSGLTIMAAPRKQGKSWFALDVALCISGGRDFWGRKTIHGKVLLFALEDTRDRIKKRVNELLDYDDAPEDLLVAYTTDYSGNEFYEDLDDYLTENSDIKLVIVDVLQKIRSEKKSSETEYGHDYKDIGELKKIADSHDIPFLVITHTRKTKDKSDRLNEIAGGVGVTAAADTILMICGDRNIDGEKTLYITGRDVQEKEISMKFDNKDCKWKYIGSKEELDFKKEKEAYDSSPVVKTVKALVEKNGGSWCGTCQELLEHGLAITGNPIAESTSALGRKLNAFEDLFLKDSIQHKRPDPNGGVRGRNHVFIKTDSLPPELFCNAGGPESFPILDILDFDMSFPEEDM